MHWYQNKARNLYSWHNVFLLLTWFQVFSVKFSLEKDSRNFLEEPKVLSTRLKHRLEDVVNYIMQHRAQKQATAAINFAINGKHFWTIKQSRREIKYLLDRLPLIWFDLRFSPFLTIWLRHREKLNYSSDDSARFKHFLSFFPLFAFYTEKPEHTNCQSVWDIRWVRRSLRVGLLKKRREKIIFKWW